MWSRLVQVSMITLPLAGCAAAESAVRSGTDFLFGTAEGQAMMDTANAAAAGLPPPWNYVAVTLLGGLAGIGGYSLSQRKTK